MAIQTLFLVEFFGVKFIDGRAYSNGSDMKLHSRRIVKSFDDVIAAKEFAEKNLDMYLGSRDKYAKRFYEVNNYVDLASSNREVSELARTVHDDLTANLDPLVIDYCFSRWYDDRYYRFMSMCLSLDLTDNSPTAVARQTKYMADTFLKDREADLRQFHGKLNHLFLRTQIENRITQFIRQQHNGNTASMPAS